VFQSGRRVAALQDVHAVAGRFVQALAAPDDLVPGALEILLAGQPASHWP
jgi:hypothetical protein